MITILCFRNERITVWIDNGDKKAELHTKTPCCDTNSTLDGSVAAANELSLYAGHKSIPLITAFLKANLGIILGVYLPTIQHIFGAIMFLRLFWIVGIMELANTLLTSISLSAVATNGVIETGGTYFMISRNLGPEFGTAVGLLFYLANACACAMYIVGAVELYLAPNMTIGSQEVHDDTGLTGMMSNNYRAYGTIILLLLFAVVALGVRFVQFFAPISLVCVLISIIAIFAGVIEKASYQAIIDTYASVNTTNENLCSYCNFDNPKLLDAICYNNSSIDSCGNHTLTCEKAFPEFEVVFFLVCLYTYSFRDFSNLGSNYMEEGEVAPKQYDITTTFFVVMAIYFPSVTGIMTGANMSGTIAAQLTTSIIYLLLILAFGSTITGPVLRDKYGKSMIGSGMVVAELAWPSPWIIMIGAFTSCFGAALQCLCSAPRLLQSIANDDILPFLRSFQLLTRWNEPFRCLILTVLIAEMIILVAALDRIAPIVDFFFLMCYAFINLACFLHSILGAPNWRPRFKCYHWTLSLFGTLLCLFIMFSTHWIYAIIVTMLCAQKGRGLTVAVALHEGQSTSKNAKSQTSIIKASECKRIDPDQLEGALSTLIQSCGIGPLRPNTLLIPYPEELHTESVYWYFLHRLQRGAMQDMCLLVLKGISYFPENEYRMAGNIDMWWILHDGGLLLLISFLLKQHKVWRNCHLRIFVVVAQDDNKSRLQQDMEKFLYEMRIDANLYACFSFLLEEFATSDISAYEIQRSLQNDISSLPRKNAQTILDQNRKQRENDESEDESKVTFHIQRESQTELKECISENLGSNSHLEHFPQDIPLQIVHSNNDVQNGKCGRKFKCERKFTFTSLDTISRKGLTNSSNQPEGHLPEERVIREVHSAVRLNGKYLRNPAQVPW
ncbi:Solute carrier family 12 member 6 [Dirofilaria immitis]|nr:Solute carrier family 12 member 6 [Dirofilaria immitis]